MQVASRTAVRRAGARAAVSAAAGSRAGAVVPARFLNLHEYQSKALLDRHGANTQRWRLATNEREAKAGAEELAASEFVVKAQVHAGGRGKGHFSESGFKGGVHLCNTPDEAQKLAGEMLGRHLVTKQTGGDGALVRSVMIVEALDFTRELYFAILLDRDHGGPVMVASTQGGMDIEKVAEETPELIFKEPVDIFKGIQPEQTERMAKALGFKNIPQAQEQMARLYDMFISNDATQVEINPLVETDAGDVYCVDAKINFDDNAEFRQKDVFAQHDASEDDPREVAAAKHDLNYIGMDGNIGCMVNGAGLAMATMDIIKLYDGEPANFLDVGGGATASQITEAFKIISGDETVKVILVNIFGGIMKCDIIAQGIVEALKQLDVKQPIVVRLAGTNVEIGQQILSDSGFNVESAEDLDDAARKAVAALP
jgi:succinyl-CoA synthetase beta subunit